MCCASTSPKPNGNGSGSRDKLAKLGGKLDRRNQKVTASSRCEPAAGLRQLKPWLARHKLTELVELRLQGRTLVVERQQAAIEQALELAGCYVVVTDVASERMSGQRVHDHYVSLQRVERDFRQLKTGLLEVRPIFVRKESRTRGHVLCSMLALKLSRELERRIQAAFWHDRRRPARDHLAGRAGGVGATVSIGISSG